MHKANSFTTSYDNFLNFEKRNYHQVSNRGCIAAAVVVAVVATQSQNDKTKLEINEINIESDINHEEKT